MRATSVSRFSLQNIPPDTSFGLRVVKNIVLTGFGHITLLDLDTIDLSNLNRQFLFKKKDVKQNKAMVRDGLIFLGPCLISSVLPGSSSDGRRL